MDSTLYCDLFLFIISIIAGIVDTLGGGGGLITVPALALTGMGAVTALGTNKFQSAIGEFSAALHFWKSRHLKLRPLYLSLFSTVIASALGTILLQICDEKRLNKIVPWLLLSVFLYYIFSPTSYSQPEKESLPENPKLLPCLGGAVGFYNGFFGPGTGAIWTIILNHIYRLRLNIATMYAKPLNIAGNVTALTIFIGGGKVNYFAALMMGIGSFLGGQIGAYLVIYKSSKLLRLLFLTIMLVSVTFSFLKYYNPL